MDKIHIVTVATESKYYFDYLKKSCEINGGKLTVLGYGEKWQGFAWRFKLMIDYLKSLNPNDIVCFVDGYDVICVRDLTELKNEFVKIKNREKCKIIVASEIHVRLGNRIFTPIFFGRCKNLSINAGTYIGCANDILEVLTKTFNLNPDVKADDQMLITKYCNLNENDVYIDKDSEIFLTILDTLNNIDNYINIDSNKNISYGLKSKPFYIHGPGSTYLDNIIIKLGYEYDYNNKINELIKKDFISKTYEQILGHIYQYRELILIIILIIIFMIIMKYNKNDKKLIENIK